MIRSSSIRGRDDRQDLGPIYAVEPHLVLRVSTETHAQLRAWREELSLPSLANISSAEYDSTRETLAQRDHLLEGRAVLEGEGAQVDAGGDLGAVLVEAGRLRVGGAVAVAAAVDRRRGDLQRLRRGCAAAPGGSASSSRRRSRRGCRAPSAAGRRGRAGPSRRSPTSRRRSPARRASRRCGRRCAIIPSARSKAFAAERRLELGRDQLRPPGVHQLDRRRFLVDAVAVEVAAVGAGLVPGAQRRQRFAQRRLTSACRSP